MIRMSNNFMRFKVSTMRDPKSKGQSAAKPAASFWIPVLKSGMIYPAQLFPSALDPQRLSPKPDILPLRQVPVGRQRHHAGNLSPNRTVERANPSMKLSCERLSLRVGSSNLRKADSCD